MGDVHVHDLAEFGSAPVVPGLCCTSGTLTWRSGIGLDGLLGKAYDAHWENHPFELVLDISNSKGDSPFPQSSVSSYTP